MTVPACACGRMAPSDFRDEISWREYRLSGLCQSCQDRVFIAFRDDGVEPRRYALRTGALVAVRRVPGASLGSAQLAFVPFVFGAPGRAVAWEPTSIVYAGPAPSLSQLTACLQPMRSALGRYQVRVCSVRDLPASLPAPRYGSLAVVIVRDAATIRDAAVVCEEIAHASSIELEPHLRERGFASLDSFVNRMGIDAGHRVADPLRTCAWMGAALELNRPDLTLFENLLQPYRIPASGSGAPVTEGH